MGKIPPATFDQPVPEPPDDLEARSHHMIRQRAWARNKANVHSDRCSVNYKVEIARAVSSPFPTHSLPQLSLLSTSFL
jgi:DNA-directed RNA polymerase